MTKRIHAVFDGKVFCPEEPVDLEINAHYLLKIEPLKKKKPTENNKDIEADPAFDLTSLAVRTGITDLAAEHDHYLRLQQSKRVDILYVDEDLWSSGWQLYENRPDKEWSLTDCISIVIMQERALTEAFTSDKHFEQAGFNALLRK